MLVHCNMKIRPEVVWFLHPDKDFTNRRLEITHCPNCRKLVVAYKRERTTNGNILVDTYSKGKAEKLLETLKPEREYTSFDLVKQKGLYGFRYGETKEVKRGDKTVLVQKSVDFYGNKEVVKSITL